MRTLARHTPVLPRTDLTFTDYLEQIRDEPVYVIVGVQGSGTNFLGRILKRFYNFSLLRDRSAVFHAAARLGAEPRREEIEREIRRFTERAFPSPLRRKVGRVLADYAAFPGIVSELRPERIRTGADFARIIHAYRAYSLGTTRMAVKSDDLWEGIDVIDAVLPNRRLLLITRDFRDNLLSVAGKEFGPVEPLCAAQYVKKQIARYAAEYRRTGDRAFHVKFETLVSSPELFLQEFTDHFGLSTVADPGTAAQQLRIRPNKTQKWRNLSAQQLVWCEGLLREELLEFGYVPVSSPAVLPGRRALLSARARDVLKRIPQKVRHVAKRLVS